MAQVVLSELSKHYPEKKAETVRAVNRINLTIEDGEFMVLVGPSGCGKSTTLRMIAGLEDISEGTVSIGGRIVNQVLPRDRDIAMVFQNYALYPHMSVRENLAFGLTIRKFAKSEIASRVRDAATMLGLTDYLDRKPKALSGGQRQRVALGRAIVRQPKVFLFDEPLSNLDAKMRASTRTEISKLHTRLGVTMVYVTHDQVEAMTMGDRICVMKDGNILQVATPLEIYNRPVNLFVAGFIGSPPMNFIYGTIQDSGGSLVFQETNPTSLPLILDINPRLVATAASYVGRPVVYGIRPENIHEIDSATQDGPNQGFVAQAEVVEPMGGETFLTLNTGATSFTARFGPTDRIAPGQNVRIRFDFTQGHLFDPASEEALS